MKLILIRHGESEWNLENRFTGWTDIDLSINGRIEAVTAAEKLKDYNIDLCLTSMLTRAIRTLNIILDNNHKLYLPVFKDFRLNERHYGALQGLNKKETAEKYGEEQVHLWRRSYKVKPPLLDIQDRRNPMFDDRYQFIDNKNILPTGESLEDCLYRVEDYYESVIKPLMRQLECILIVAHGNSLRALLKIIENISDEDIVNLEIPTGVPYVLEFDNDLKLLNIKKL